MPRDEPTKRRGALIRSGSARSGTKLKRAGADTGDAQKVTPAIDSLFLIAVDDDGVGKRCAKPGHARKQRGGGRVEVDADRIHRILDDGVEGTGEPGLIDVMSP